MRLEPCPLPFARTEPPSAHADAGELVGSSPVMRDALGVLRHVAPTAATVLILGETGTGKGLAAREVHRLSPRRHGRFVSVDCGSLPPTLIESELFGREKGAFTDARSTQIGRFELADRGTIFLDEIGELPPELQVKLLRVLQSGEFERLGSPRTLRVDVRVIAATNRNLMDDVRAGRFRRDLYYRLNVVPVRMPALRERQEDIPLLVEHLIKRLSEKYQRRVAAFPRHALDSLMAHDWPGNVRELENVIERAVIAMTGPTLPLLEALDAETSGGPAGPTSDLMVEVERAHIVRMLHATGWRIEGACGAAQRLGLKASTLRSRMRKLGVRRAAGRLRAVPVPERADARLPVTTPTLQ
jgi:transcriptional regulator with GAF, ATPase, and Fis domain